MSLLSRRRKSSCSLELPYQGTGTYERKFPYRRPALSPHAGSGFSEVKAEPRMVYVDSSKPELLDGFILKTIIPMVEGIKEQAWKCK